jgi:small subunit ribosomal protein S17
MIHGDKMKKISKKDIGLDAKQPKEICKNEKCPWHGSLKIRGRIFRGTVMSNKGMETAIVQWNRYNYVQKYERYERRKSRVAAHNPPCIAAKNGDIVRIGECRPLSKAKSFVIFEKL